jgi:hypothetical protein
MEPNMRSLWLVATLALGACLPSFDRGSNREGGPNGASGPAGVPPGVTLDAAPVVMHRLTPQQYRHTVRDLLGLTDADVASIKLPVDDGTLPSLLTVSQLDDNAAALVALGAHKKLVPCDINQGDDACAAKFISAFATKAFRHPITAQELGWATNVFASAKAQFSFAESIDVVVRAILQSPQLVYLREEGESEKDLPAGMLRVGQYELASRLSYLFWDSMPDDALFDAATKKELTSDGLRAQATRMLADPRARTKMVQFVSTWLELDGTAKHVSIEEAVKDPARYPLDSAALRKAVRREMEEFVGHVWDRGASVNELFTSTDAYVNGPLAELYGVTNGPKGDTWSWVTLPADKRGGLLTRAAFLLVYANPDIPSPIRRGAAIWREFMCTTFPPPPPAAMDVKIQGGGTDASGKPLSIRDNVDARTLGAPECAGCHSKINPAGFALGHFDALGQWQDVERGTAPGGAPYSATIDDTGELVGSDVPGVVGGAVQFSAKLASSRQVKDCVASRVWRSAFGRDVAPQESSSLRYVQDRLASSGTLREAMLAVVESPAFQFMRKAAP